MEEEISGFKEEIHRMEIERANLVAKVIIFFIDAELSIVNMKRSIN